MTYYNRKSEDYALSVIEKYLQQIETILYRENEKVKTLTINQKHYFLLIEDLLEDIQNKIISLCWDLDLCDVQSNQMERINKDFNWTLDLYQKCCCLHT